MQSDIESLKERIFSKYQKENWEIKTLNEICHSMYIGSEVKTEQLGTGDYPAIKCRDVNSAFSIKFEKCVSYVNPDLIKTKKYFECGDILVGKIGDRKTSGTAVAYVGKEKCILGDAVYALKHKQNPVYLSYALSTESIRNQIELFEKGGVVFNFFIREIKQIRVPLPPLEIQDKIVEFLDKLTELKNELELELENRKKQYEYYKNLVFNKGINELNWEVKKLEDISIAIYSGDKVSKEQLNTGNYPAVKCGDINSYLPKQFDKCISFVDINLITNKKYFEKGDLLISHFGDQENAGTSCVYLGNEKCLAGKNVYVIKHNQNPKFLNYCWSSEFVRNQINDALYGGIVSYLFMRDLKK